MTSTTSDSIWLHGALLRVLVDGAQTGGNYALVECLAPAGSRPPCHVHTRESEGLVVLEGEVTLHTPLGARVLRPGDAAHSPAGEPHTFEVTGAGPARMLVVSQPAGLVEFLRAAGVPAAREAIPTALEAPEDRAALTAAAAAAGIRFIEPAAPAPVPARPPLAAVEVPA